MMNGVTTDLANSVEDKNLVTVSRKDLDTLAREVKMLKHFLPQVLDKDLTSAYSQLADREEEIDNLRSENEVAHSEVDHWQSRYEAMVEEFQQEKQEKTKLHREVQDLTDQMSEQSEYCAAMGASACTLLWRVSRCEESIESILGGSKTDDFLKMASTTLESFMATFKDESLQEQMEEMQFVVAICGLVTNIAASAYGREFLITNQYGKETLDTFIKVLSETANRGPWTRMKNLILMSLYNVSINQKGMKYLSTRPGLIGILVWLLQDVTETENQVNALRLIQSLTCEQENKSVLSEAREMLSFQYLQELTIAKHPDIRDISKDIIKDLFQ